MKKKDNFTLNILSNTLKSIFPCANVTDIQYALELAWELTGTNSKEITSSSVINISNLPNKNQEHNNIYEILNNNIRDPWYCHNLREILLNSLYIPSIRFKGTQSLSCELITILALAIIIYRNYKINYRRIDFNNIDLEYEKTPLAIMLSVRLTGVRLFLHPPFEDMTLWEQRGRYLLIKLLTKAITAGMLKSLLLPSINCLTSSLCRFLILTNYEDLEKIPEIIEQLTLKLKKIDYNLGLEFLTVDIKMQDINKNNFGIKYLNVNQEKTDKINLRVKFTFDSKRNEKLELRNYLYYLGESVAKYEYLMVCNSNKEKKIDFPGYHLIGKYMPIWYYFRDSDIISNDLKLTRKSLFADASPSFNNFIMSSSIKEILANYSDSSEFFGVLRLDADDYVKNLSKKSGKSLISLLTYNSFCIDYFINKVPKICQDFNKKNSEKYQVVLLYSEADDIIIAGAVRSLLLLKDEICVTYENITGGTLSFGLGKGTLGMNMAQISRDALCNLVDMKLKKKNSKTALE